MKPKFKIVIPEPCNENWDKMTADATGRFCLVCNKSVIDFSNMTSDEIQQFLKNSQEQKICGRFKNSQLYSINIQIPQEVLFSQTHYHKIFLLALFIVMGTSLFSCSTVNGDKQKIKKVEVVNLTQYQARTEKDSILRKQKNDTEEPVNIGSEFTTGPMSIYINPFQKEN